MVAAKQNQKFPFHFLSVSYRNCTLFTSDYRCSGSCGNVPHFLTPHTLFPFATLRILAKTAILFFGCGTWIRTKIPCSRGMCPTIRRSRNLICRPCDMSVGYTFSPNFSNSYFFFFVLMMADFIKAEKRGCGARG